MKILNLINIYISQRMMTEEPESYQRMLHSLVSRAQQVHSCLMFHLKKLVASFGSLWLFYSINKFVVPG